MHALRPLEPCYTAALLAPLHAELVALLRSLSTDDWPRPAVGSWRVRDVVAHLLDIDVRRLSFHRDSRATPVPPQPIQNYGELVTFLNALNAEWVRIAERMSERVLVDLIEITGPQVAAFLAALPPHEVAYWPVAWAGERVSENWMDVGRDYTERWHHQAQIRAAVGAPALDARQWMLPVLDLSVRALPRAFRRVDAPAGSAVVLEVTGEAGGVWSLVRDARAWAVHAGESPRIDARVRLDPDAAWRLFFNALRGDDAAKRIHIEGDRRLGEAVATVRAVMV